MTVSLNSFFIVYVQLFFQAIVLSGWLLSTGFCLTVLYGLSGVAAGSYANSNAVTALYWAMSRFTWALGVSWVIFACLSGNAVWINCFLSWRGFAPLSRLTFCAYLVHPIVIGVVYSNLRQAQVLTTFGLVSISQSFEARTGNSVTRVLNPHLVLICIFEANKR